MTVAEKRKALEFFDRLVRYDVLSDEDIMKILNICEDAIDRGIKGEE